MRLSGSAVKGFGSLFAARVYSGAMTFLLFAVLARSLPSAAFGLFAAAYSISYLFAAVADGGFGMLVIREVSRTHDTAGYYLGSFLPTRLLSAFLILVSAAVGAAVADWASTAATVLLACAAANLQVVSGAPRDFLIAIDRNGLAAAHWIVETTLRTLIVILIVLANGSIAAIFVGIAAFHAVFLAIGFPWLWMLLRPHGIGRGARSWRMAIREAAPFGVFVVLGAVYGQIDVVIASLILPLSEVAVLSVALRILAATDYAPEAAWRWAYPHLSRAPEHGPSGRTVGLDRLGSWLTIGGIAVAVAIVLSSPWLIPAVFGSEYSASVQPMLILAAAIPVRYGSHAYGTALSAIGRQRRRSILYGGIVALTVGADVLLMMAFGVIGAAVSVVLTSTVLLLAYLRETIIALAIPPSLRPAIGAVLFGLLVLAGLTIVSLRG